MTYKQITIGIDCGANGAIVVGVMTDTHIHKPFVYKMPENPQGLTSLFKKISGLCVNAEKVVCYLEHVHAFPSSRPDNSPEHLELIGQIERLSKELPLVGEILTKAVTSLKDKKVADRGATAQWTFALGVGSITQVLSDFDIVPELVSAVTWQKDYVARGGAKQDRKNLLKAKAQHYFPDIRATLQNCDALLIYHYALQQTMKVAELPF